MIRFPARGTWRPGLTNPGLLAVQLLTLVQAAYRGLDYLGGVPAGDPIQRAVEGAAPYPVWGGLFYGLAVLVLLGVAGRWPAVMIVGHLALSALYLGIGLLVLSTTAGLDAAGVLGLTASAAGVWFLLSARVTSITVRLGVAVPLMIAGQLAVVDALGTNYRTGTGLLVAGLSHGALAAGISWTYAKQRAGGEWIPRG